MTLRLVVTGGRYYSNEATVAWALNTLHQRDGIELLIHGDASGGDRLCGAWATTNHIACQPCAADWNDMSEPCVVKYRRDGSPYNALAGFNRNQQMIDVWQPNYAVAFHGNNGTARYGKANDCGGFTAMGLTLTLTLALKPLDLLGHVRVLRLDHRYAVRQQPPPRRADQCVSYLRERA